MQKPFALMEKLYMDFTGVFPTSADFLFEPIGRKKHLEIGIQGAMLWTQFIKLQELFQEEKVRLYKMTL